METIVIHFQFDNHFVTAQEITDQMNRMIGNNMKSYGYSDFVAEKIVSIAVSGIDLWAVVQVREIQA